MNNRDVDTAALSHKLQLLYKRRYWAVVAQHHDEALTRSRRRSRCHRLIAFSHTLRAICTGLCGYAFQTTMTMALRRAKAAPATAMSYLSIIWCVRD